MSKPGTIELPFGDGRHPFCLPLAQVRELQEKTGRGPLALLRRAQDGEWLVDELRETIRLGLIGGGMEAIRALKLVEGYFDPPEHPKTDHMPVVTAILMAFLVGIPTSKKKPLKKASATPTN